MKQKLMELKRETDSSTITIGDFNTPLIILDRTTRRKISKETEDLSNTVNQPDLTVMPRTLHPVTEVHTSFSGAHGALSRRDRTLSH